MGYDGERPVIEEDVPLTQTELTYLMQRMFNAARANTSFETQLMKKLQKHRDIALAKEDPLLSDM